MRINVEEEEEGKEAVVTQKEEVREDVDQQWGFREDVEGLRGLAVLLVLLFHARVPGVSGGFVGVDVFFVISGFVITRVLLKESLTSGSIDLKRFYYWRFRRLLPNSALCLLLTIVAGQWLLDPISNLNMLNDAQYTSMYCLNMKYAQLNGYFLQQDEPSPLVHYWSLAVEEQFYLMWPFVLYFFSTQSPVVLFMLLTASLLYCQFQSGVDSSFAYFALPSRGWQLLFGAMVAFNQSPIKKCSSWIRSIGAIVGVALITASSNLFSSKTVYPGLASLVPTIGATLVLIGDSQRLIGNVLSNAVFRWIGAKSYSLYLYHWPLVVYYTSLTSRKFQYSPTTQSCSIGVLISIPLALIANTFVESPIRRRGEKLSPAIGIAIGVGVSLLMFLFALSLSHLQALEAPIRRYR